MNRRRLLATVGGVVPTGFAGCLGEFSDGTDDADSDEDADPGDVEPRGLREWPDEESHATVTAYATQYMGPSSTIAASTTRRTRTRPQLQGSVTGDRGSPAFYAWSRRRELLV